MDEHALKLNFHGDLCDLLTVPHNFGCVNYVLSRRASIKDICESLGVVHPEVGKIVMAGKLLTFSHIAMAGQELDIYPNGPDIGISTPTVLRYDTLAKPAFMVDVNVLKLARNLRLAGLDTTVVPGGSLGYVARAAARQKRILLTRNRDLLKIRIVSFAQLIRSENHLLQLKEVVHRYNLRSLFQPFSRCLNCNGMLRAVEKQEIFHLLEPLTQKYYQTFKQCDSCAKIYWQGSHCAKMQRLLAEMND